MPPAFLPDPRAALCRASRANILARPCFTKDVWGVAMLLKSGANVYIYVYIKHALYLKFSYFSNS